MKTLLTALLALTLSACNAGNLADEAHSVDEYRADRALASATVEACRARNEAEANAMLSKPACANVRAAEMKRTDDAQAAAIDASNDAMEQLMEQRRARRAKAG